MATPEAQVTRKRNKLVGPLNFLERKRVHIDFSELERRHSLGELIMFRILVVDDEESNLQAIRRIFLDENDCELKFSDNGAEALRLAEDFTPDLVLLDIKMPDIDGYEVCQIIKSNPKTAESMVLFLSGNSQLSDRLKGYAVLADDYVTKPYESKELIAKVRILLRLKKAQDELRDAKNNLEKIVAQRTRQLVIAERQAIVGRMVHGIVHNFRNPLTIAFGFARLIEKNIGILLPYSANMPPYLQDTFEKTDGYIKQVVESTKRIEVLLESLLQKGRKDATVTDQKLNLNYLIASEVKFLEADPEFKYSVTKHLHLDPHLPDFLGNYADFSQLCSNMINNAVDAMKYSSIKEITIRTRYDTGNLYIDFQDTGQGIPPQIIDHIFEPFFTTKPLKGEESEKEPTGTGLGLYSCQQLMNAYNGSITVQSELQVGTTFTVTIPY